MYRENNPSFPGFYDKMIFRCQITNFQMHPFAKSKLLQLFFWFFGQGDKKRESQYSLTIKFDKIFLLSWDLKSKIQLKLWVASHYFWQTFFSARVTIKFWRIFLAFSSYTISIILSLTIIDKSKLEKQRTTEQILTLMMLVSFR